jgi:hypothetical protein
MLGSIAQPRAEADKKALFIVDIINARTTRHHNLSKIKSIQNQRRPEQ